MEYKRLTDVNAELDDLRQKGVRRGYSVGFPWEVFPYTVKLGCTTYLGASPGAGKTELLKEFQINLSCLHGFNHVIFTPETGSVAETYAEFCHALVGKAYIKGKNAMTEAEKVQAEMFVDQHFIILDPMSGDLSVTEFYNMIDDIENETGKKIHTTTLDPWNELSEQLIAEDMGREDKYVSRVLGMVRKNAQRTNRHHFIVNHVRDQAPITKKGITYYPMPSAREFAGGQSWFRKALTMIIPWRPPVGLKADDSFAYMENQAELFIAKAKPKGVAKKGIYRLFLDMKRYQYYYFNEQGKIHYADRGKNWTYTPPQKDVIERMNYFDKTQQFNKDKKKYDDQIIDEMDGPNITVVDKNSDEIPF